MRKLGLAFSCLLLVLLAVVLVGPSFIDWADHKETIAREASRLSGRVLTIDGAMDLALLPHPRLQDRAFVLVPMLDVAADWVHPLLARSVTQLCADLPAAAREEVVSIGRARDP